MPHARTLSDLPPSTLAWLWHRYLPRARLTLLAADPGAGKTALALDLAARLSTAQPMPPLPITPIANGQPPIDNPASTLLITPDPAPDDVLLPRLASLHANPDFIHCLSVTPCNSPAPLFTALSENIPLLQTPANNLQLVVIDPITAYLPLVAPDASLYRLAQLARQFDVAILLTTRLAKSFPANVSPSHLRRALGSLAFASAARCAHLILPNPKSPSENSNSQSAILIPVKSNLGPLPPPLAFSLSASLDWHPQPVSTSLLRNDLLIEHAETFLREFLADGPRSAASVFAAAERSAISKGTLVRAKATLNVLSKKTGAYDPWTWSLPGDVRPFKDPDFPNLAAPPTPPAFDEESISEMLRLLAKSCAP